MPPVASAAAGRPTSPAARPRPTEAQRARGRRARAGRRRARDGDRILGVEQAVERRLARAREHEHGGRVAGGGHRPLAARGRRRRIESCGGEHRRAVGRVVQGARCVEVDHHEAAARRDGPVTGRRNAGGEPAGAERRRRATAVAARASAPTPRTQTSAAGARARRARTSPAAQPAAIAHRSRPTTATAAGSAVSIVAGDRRPADAADAAGAGAMNSRANAPIGVLTVSPARSRSWQARRRGPGTRSAARGARAPVRRGRSPSMRSAPAGQRGARRRRPATVPPSIAATAPASAAWPASSWASPASSNCMHASPTATTSGINATVSTLAWPRSPTAHRWDSMLAVADTVPSDRCVTTSGIATRTATAPSRALVTFSPWRNDAGSRERRRPWPVAADGLGARAGARRRAGQPRRLPRDQPLPQREAQGHDHGDQRDELDARLAAPVAGDRRSESGDNTPATIPLRACTRWHAHCDKSAENQERGSQYERQRRYTR